MTYATIEVSTEDGRPVELYEFQRNGVYWRFTSADVDIDYSANTYTATAIQRSAIEQSQDFAKATLNVDLPRTISFASSFLQYSADNPTILNIYRDHFGDGDWQVYWKGRVAAASASDSMVRLECESVFSSLKRKGLRAKYQRMCRHVLYDSNCTLDPDLFKFEATVDAISGNDITFTLTVPDAGKLTDYFQAGMFENADGVKRFIKSQSSNTVTISYPFESVAVSDTVYLYAGCQHRDQEDCLTKFNNLNNYGGFPYYPTDDGPFAGRSIV